ncbi:MAG: hypothetical protein KF768_01295 [Phycisphaeraceae bacterium]|nr:hypothetical protein [Phycisphaeraceae bacterium]
MSLTRSTLRSPGFTLIEAIGAIVLLSIAVPVMFWALRDAQLRRADPASLTVARWLAVERMETVIADRHAPARGYAHIIPANYPAESPVPGFPSHTRTVTITETGPALTGPGSGYKFVRVSVTYQGAGGAQRTFELTSIVTDY